MNCMFLITNESQIAGVDLIVLLTMQGDLSTKNFWLVLDLTNQIIGTLIRFPQKKMAKDVSQSLVSSKHRRLLRFCEGKMETFLIYLQIKNCVCMFLMVQLHHLAAIMLSKGHLSI